MPYNGSSVSAYLEAFARKPHALARLVAHPRPDGGVVHTPREISQQPFLWRLTARTMREHAPSLRRFLERTGLYDRASRPHLILTGAGTSDYVGASLADLLRRHFQVPCSNWPTTRITAHPEAFLMESLRYVMLHFARSGNSPESKAVLELGLRNFSEVSRHVVITCNGEGDLATLARAHPDKVYLIVLDQATCDIGLAMTSSFSNMLVAGQALVHLDDMDVFVDLIDETAAAGEHLIDTYADAIFGLADEGTQRVFYLGNNDLLGAATESALKVQELTAGSITAKGEDTMAFRHGPVSAVNGQSMVCFFLSADEYTRQYELDVVLQFQQAFQRIGTRTVVVSPVAPDPRLAPEIVFIPIGQPATWHVPAFYQANLAVLFGQMYGLFTSLARNVNVDDPSVHNALYSRTVQGVRLYEYVGSSNGSGDGAIL